MSLRKIQFSFRADVTTFMAALSSCPGVDLHIDLFGDQKPARPPRMFNGKAAPKLLEHKSKRPRPRKGEITSAKAILAFFVLHKDERFKAAQIGPVLSAIGRNPKSASPQLSAMVKTGLIKHGKDGSYQVTARGLARHRPTAEG